MNRHDISNMVEEYADKFGPTNRPERNALEKVLRTTDSTELFEGLFSVFLSESDQHSYIRQQNAGVILYKLQPRLFIDLKSRIRMCLSTWNVSVEELPYYVVERCGKERVLKVLDELRNEVLSKHERKSLEAFVYWLKSYV